VTLSQGTARVFLAPNEIDAVIDDLARVTAEPEVILTTAVSPAKARMQRFVSTGQDN